MRFEWDCERKSAKLTQKKKNKQTDSEWIVGTAEYGHGFVWFLLAVHTIRLGEYSVHLWYSSRETYANCWNAHVYNLNSKQTPSLFPPNQCQLWQQRQTIHFKFTALLRDTNRLPGNAKIMVMHIGMYGSHRTVIVQSTMILMRARYKLELSSSTFKHLEKWTLQCKVTIKYGLRVVGCFPFCQRSAEEARASLQNSPPIRDRSYSKRFQFLQQLY